MKDIFGKINFFIASFISILGFALIYEVFAEDDFVNKIDDMLMVVLGIGAIMWYKISGHKGTSGSGAVIISGLAVLIKILAIVVEHADKEAVGDDIGIIISLLLTFLFVIWQVVSHRRASE